jgi:3-methylcrotonyl-CoA carboxylase beta subunit
MAEEKKENMAEDDGNLGYWEEQDAILMKHREEAYHIGGEEQIKRLAKQGKKPMRELITMLIDPGT